MEMAELFFRCFCRFLLFQPAAFAQGFVDNPLELSVGAAKFVGSPFFNGFHRSGINTKYETFGGIFFLSHSATDSELMVQRSGIHNRLCGFVSAKHYQQVAYHGRFFLFVELHDVVFR